VLEGLQPPERILSCHVRTLRESFDESDRAIFDKAILDQHIWPSKTLAKALTDRGVQISDKPIRMHRLGRCSCR
jgi:hypothetical protein